ncbi:hypothetical protein [Brevibacterium mcbrellneri]|uniref:hypothetical protein n=1 Tax=Brevibacterium mcbrellneri TaxID=53363 RepID=UPI0012EA2938|nr:hypothetical protein [Brevibacterium mcbrellneri]
MSAPTTDRASFTVTPALLATESKPAPLAVGNAANTRNSGSSKSSVILNSACRMF